jgi:carbonic anhydrase
MMKKLKLFVSIGAMICSVNLLAAEDSAVKVKWGYLGAVGPAHWGKLDSHFLACAAGKMQSPINIDGQIKKAADNLIFSYSSAPMVIMDNGDTELMIGKTQTIVNEGHGVQLNFADPKTKELVTFEGKDYRLVQFHIHTPSENNLRGKSYPLEIHFVHQGDDGKILVVGVFAKVGAENPVLQKIIDHLPKEEGKPFNIKGEFLNPMNLFPQKQDHYNFSGSLTTPPCTEGLQWIVMSNPISVSEQQVAKLRAAAAGPNARPVQPLNKRAISYSVVKQ